MTDTRDQGLFNPEDNAPVFDETVSVRDQLVGEGKKYKDEEALARSRVEADSFIERLQRENALLRGEIQQRETMEDLVKRLTPPKASKDTEDEAIPPTPGSANTDNLTPDKVRELLSQELATRTEQDRRNNNARAVRQELVNRYGPNWQTQLKAKQEELEVSEEFLTELAQTQPKTFFRLLGEAPKNEQSFTPPASVIDSAKTRSTPGNIKNKAYYDKILREQGLSVYMSPRIQNEMQANARKLGDQFYS